MPIYENVKASDVRIFYLEQGYLERLFVSRAIVPDSIDSITFTLKTDKLGIS